MENVIPVMLVSPVINLNGTSGEELEAQYAEAYWAAENALAAFRKISPHGRDWQTYPEAYDGARKSWAIYAKALEETRDALMDVRISLRNQQEARGK